MAAVIAAEEEEELQACSIPIDRQIQTTSLEMGSAVIAEGEAAATGACYSMSQSLKMTRSV